MSEWAKRKLGELIIIKHGYAFKGRYFVDRATENILLTPGNFALGGGFQNLKPKYYDGPLCAEYILKPGSLVVTMTDLSKSGDTLGYPALIPKDSKNKFLLNQRIGLVSKKQSDIDLKFIYFVLKTHSYQRFVVGSASGATVKHTSPKKMYEYEVLIPGLSTQISITAVLSAYDDLIENNEKRIKILEEMAERLYREWFVKFKFPGHEKIRPIDSGTEYGKIPEGWKVKQLASLTKYLSRGISPKYDNNGNSIVVNQKCIRNHTLKLDESRRQSKTIPPEKQMLFGDILINSTGVGTLGRVAQVYDQINNCTVDTHVTIVRPISQEYIDFLGLALFDKQPVFELLGAGATGQTELSRDSIGSLEIVTPPLSLMTEFSQAVHASRNEIISLQKKNKLLALTRDLLIPQLVDGRRGVK